MKYRAIDKMKQEMARYYERKAITTLYEKSGLLDSDGSLILLNKRPQSAQKSIEKINSLYGNNGR